MEAEHRRRSGAGQVGCRRPGHPVQHAGTQGIPGVVRSPESRGLGKVFALLVRGPVMGMHHALTLSARGGGSIINTAAIAAWRRVGAALPIHRHGRGGAHGAGSAAEMSHQKISVNASPGLIATSIFGDAIGRPATWPNRWSPGVAQHVSTASRPKTGLPETFDRAALYLASDDSAFVTGRTSWWMANHHRSRQTEEPASGSALRPDHPNIVFYNIGVGFARVPWT